MKRTKRSRKILRNELVKPQVGETVDIYHRSNERDDKYFGLESAPHQQSTVVAVMNKNKVKVASGDVWVVARQHDDRALLAVV